jgi:hypothetical protein
MESAAQMRNSSPLMNQGAFFRGFGKAEQNRDPKRVYYLWISAGESAFAAHKPACNPSAIT